jgi:hypothetical protein
LLEISDVFISLLNENSSAIEVEQGDDCKIIKKQKKVAVTFFKVLSKCMCGESGESHRKPWSG